MSSPTLYAVEGVDQEAFNSVFNYAILKNLPYNTGFDYKTKLDQNSPIFVDVYGNIVTESGIVVIPAAANATYYGNNPYCVYNAGFISGYDKVWAIPNASANCEKYLANYFIEDTDNEKWVLKQTISIGDNIVSAKGVSVSNVAALKSFYSLALSRFGTGQFSLDFGNTVWLIMEVMRGAPLEFVDFEKEGLVFEQDDSRIGLLMAAKLENIITNLLPNVEQNFILSLPNLAFMEGVEYVIAYGVKIFFCITSIFLMYNIYVDAIEHRFGLGTIGTFCIALFSFVAALATIPIVLNFSYYGANKTLLQNETTLINLITAEKQAEGKEIGVSEVTAPTSTTKIYLKVDNINVEWYKSFGDILLSNSMDTMDEVYEDAFKNSVFANMEGMERKASGVYIDVANLFKTTSIGFNSDYSYLYHRVKSEPYASFVTPYYYILDSLIAQTNAYNNAKRNVPYATRIIATGETKTVGLIRDYLSSNSFMEDGVDITGLRTLYNPDSILLMDNVIDTSQYDAMKQSQWYRTGLNEKSMNKKLEDIERSARLYVIDNIEFLGKVTDEVFLKCLALHIALEHNDIMNIGACRGYEIMNIDPLDVIRVSLVNKVNMISSVSESFARFVYNSSGTLGIILTAILIAITFVGIIVRFASLTVILVVMVYSLLLRKILRREGSQVILGYLLATGLLIASNMIYAGLLKLSFLLPNFGLNSILCIIFQILIQVLYLIILSAITSAVVKDRDNMGFNVMANTAMGLVGFVGGAAYGMTSKAGKSMYEGVRSRNRAFHDEYNKRTSSNSAESSASIVEDTLDYLDEMKRRDDERKQKVRGRRVRK